MMAKRVGTVGCQSALMVTGLGRGPSECNDRNRGRLKSTRVVCGYRGRLWSKGWL